MLIFSTPKEVTQHTAKIWAKDVQEKLGVQLIVVPREEFITWLMDPANADICRDWETTGGPRYHFEQGITERLYRIEDIFDPELLST